MYYYYWADAGVIEVHYRFFGNGHSMDAIVQNKCEGEVLRIIKEAARTCKITVIIETEAKAEGGLINRYRLMNTNPNGGSSPSPISKTVLTALITAICVAPITVAVNGISETVKTAVTNTKDPEKDSLEKEKLRTEIDNSRADIEIKKEEKERDSLENEKLKLDIKTAEKDLRSKLLKANSKIAVNKTRARFYSELGKDERVASVSVQVFNGLNVLISPEYTVGRDDFKELSVDRSKQLRIDTDAGKESLEEDFKFYLPPTVRTVKHEPKRLNSKNPSIDSKESE